MLHCASRLLSQEIRTGGYGDIQLCLVRYEKYVETVESCGKARTGNGSKGGEQPIAGYL